MPISRDRLGRFASSAISTFRKKWDEKPSHLKRSTLERLNEVLQFKSKGDDAGRMKDLKRRMEQRAAKRTPERRASDAAALARAKSFGNKGADIVERFFPENMEKRKRWTGQPHRQR